MGNTSINGQNGKSGLGLRAFAIPTLSQSFVARVYDRVPANTDWCSGPQ